MFRVEIIAFRILTTGGCSCLVNVFDADVPDEAPTDDADAFVIDDVSD